jgi:two-component system invasion response regulator UvrY
MIKIIIADDHPAIREAWLLMLNLQEGIQVIAACGSGEELLACCTAQTPDIVLMDINMQPMNGFQAASLLLQKFPSVRIIGISINPETVYAEKLLQMGAKGFITKNAASEEMVKGIREVMTGKIYICREVKSRMRADGC